MSWLKSGDNAATYPLLLEVGMLEEADDRLLNEVAGFVWRCASQSAGHLTNGVIDLGTASLLGGARVRELTTVAVAAGLLTRVTVNGRTAFQIVEDPDFLHIRDKESVKWDQQRDRDRKSPELTTAVRRRDGDACRYCGCIVNFAARKGGRSGTYDHFEPGQPASVDTYVVACRAHNSSMQDGERLPLLDPPAKPYYTSKTLAWLEENGRRPLPGSYVTEPCSVDDPDVTEGGHRRDTARTALAEDTAAPRDPDPAATAATRTPPPAATPGHAAPTRERDPFADAEKELDQEERRQSRSDPGKDPDRKGGARSGRDGTGRAGSGRAGAGASPPQGGRRRSRGRRGRGGAGGGAR